MYDTQNGKIVTKGGVVVELDGFGNIFGVIRKNPRVIFPALIGVAVALLLNIISFEYSRMLKTMNFGWIPFSFEIFKWGVAFTLSGLTTLLMKKNAKESHELFSKIFLDVFIFSTFMAFFVVTGFGLYVVPGLLILFFMIYIPIEMVLEQNTSSLERFKGNLNFILEDAHVIHTFIALLLIIVFTLIPYIGEYIAMFFYILWIPNIYISGKKENDEEVEW